MLKISCYLLLICSVGASEEGDITCSPPYGISKENIDDKIYHHGDEIEIECQNNNNHHYEIMCTEEGHWEIHENECFEPQPIEDKALYDFIPMGNAGITATVPQQSAMDVRFLSPTSLGNTYQPENTRHNIPVAARVPVATSCPYMSGYMSPLHKYHIFHSGDSVMFHCLNSEKYFEAKCDVSGRWMRMTRACDEHHEHEHHDDDDHRHSHAEKDDDETCIAPHGIVHHYQERGAYHKGDKIQLECNNAENLYYNIICTKHGHWLIEDNPCTKLAQVITKTTKEAVYARTIITTCQYRPMYMNPLYRFQIFNVGDRMMLRCLNSAGYFEAACESTGRWMAAANSCKNTVSQATLPGTLLFRPMHSLHVASTSGHNTHPQGDHVISISGNEITHCPYLPYYMLRQYRSHTFNIGDRMAFRCQNSPGFFEAVCDTHGRWLRMTTSCTNIHVNRPHNQSGKSGGLSLMVQLLARGSGLGNMFKFGARPKPTHNGFDVIPSGF